MTEVPLSPFFEPPEPPPDRVLRRLPWQGPEGRPAHLVSGDGYLSRLADDIERQQLDSARSVWDVATSVLDDPRAERDALRFAAVRLRESLGDVLQLTLNRGLYTDFGSATSPYVKRWLYDLRCVGTARHDLRRVLAAWELDDLADRAELVLSELLSNAFQHADVPPDSEVETRYERLPKAIRIEVHDADDAKPRVQLLSTETESGRGLALVHALTGGEWGVGPREGVGKRVWAVVKLDDPAWQATA
ncbi:ATP-binding protein [Streptomyces sp. NPDC021020]|uniref:ATP-binding protein n=1 Tax=Streptomyces sp. NPDC021020 TaxID=3365109 RepID=UPI0037AC9E4E